MTGTIGGITHVQNDLPSRRLGRRLRRRGLLGPEASRAGRPAIRRRGKKFLEYQLQISQKIQQKLDQLQNKTAAAPAKGASGFLGSGQAPAVSAADVNDVKADNQKQQEELQKRLAQLK